MRLPDRVGDQARIGVAIEVPEPWGSLLQQARAEFGDPWARSIPPHVTLLGPTVVERADVPVVHDHLRGVAAQHEPFTVHLRGTGTFRPVSDVVFVQVVQGISECEQLESAVRSGPLDQELRFNYHPHVTVAHDVPGHALDRAFEEMAGFEAVFAVDRFLVFEHGDDGVWRPEVGFELAAEVRSRG